jgi:hypothetical protein
LFNSYLRTKSPWGAALKKRLMFVVGVPALPELASPFGDLSNLVALGIAKRIYSQAIYLSATDIANAWAYAEAFPDEIEIEIRENDEVIRPKL